MQTGHIETSGRFDMASDKDGWEHEQSLVMHELKRLSSAFEALELRLIQRENSHQEEHIWIRESIATIKVKTGAIGTLAGAVTTGIIIIGILLGTWIKSDEKPVSPTSPVEQQK